MNRWKKLLAMLMAVIMCISFTPQQISAAEDYRTWSQADERWGSLPLGTSDKTVKSSGCLVTSVTKLIIQCGLKESANFTPDILVKWLNDNGGFSGASLVWAKPAEYVDGFALYSNNLYSSGNYSISSYTDDIIEYIKDGLHIVLQVKDGGHWVAVDEAMTLSHNEIYIMDTLTGKENADIRLQDRYDEFNRAAAYTGGITPTVPEEEPEEIPDESPDETPDDTPEEVPDENPDDTPEELPDEEQDNNQIIIPDNGLDKIPGDKVEDILPDDSSNNPFVDVEESAYYYDAVLWAYENDITTGTDNRHFSPNEFCNRAQIVTFLWRTKGCPQPSSKESPFEDVTNADAYYYDAVLWALEHNITTGADETHFQPEAVCTREQIVTFLWRAAGCPQPESADNPFADITNADAYYYDAVLWALEHNITTGLDETHFGPKQTCTRGQVVTFLYRSRIN